MKDMSILSWSVFILAMGMLSIGIRLIFWIEESNARMEKIEQWQNYWSEVLPAIHRTK